MSELLPGPHNALVIVRGADVAPALAKLKRLLMANGTQREIRLRESYVSKSRKRRLKRERAITRLRKSRQRALAFDLDKPIRRSAGPQMFRPMPPSKYI